MRKLLLIFLSFIAAVSHAQTIERKAVFVNGQKLEKHIKGSSVTFIERNEQKLEIKLTSELIRSYLINNRTDRFEISSMVKKIKNIYSAMNAEVLFDSDQQNDSTSLIVKSLGSILNVTTHAMVDKDGVVRLVENLTVQQKNNSVLASLTAIPEDKFIKGSTTELIANLPMNIVYKAGEGWVDSVAIKGGKQVINYIVKSIDDKIAVIDLYGEITTVEGKNIAQSEINGQMEVDIKTGIITKRSIDTKSTIKTEDKKGLLTVTKTSSVIETVKLSAI